MKIRWYTAIITLQIIGLVVSLFISIPTGNFHHFVHELILALTFTNLTGISGTLLYGIYRGMHSRIGGKWFWIIFLVSMGLLALAVTAKISLWIGGYICGLDQYEVNRWHLFIIIVDFMVSAVFIVFAILLALYERLSASLGKKIRENEKLQRLHLETRLSLLQSKINPHFLFNTLNTMLDILKKDPETVEKIILNLSNIYRKTLTLPEHTLVPIDEELELVREYLDIEKVRMGERLRFDIFTKPDTENLKVPPMILQMLVENAVKHGISPQQEGGTVNVNVDSEPGFIRLEVTDNGVGFKETSDQKGFGLYSIKQRLNMLYKDASMEIKQLADHGTCIRILIPHAA